MQKYSIGFSFIELMITLTVIGLLALLAYPSYIQHQLKANREQAKQLLLACSAELTLHYKTVRSYANIAPSPLPSEPILICNKPFIQALKHPAYRLMVTKAKQDTYQLMAQRQGRQLQDDCGDLTLDHIGRKTHTNSHKTPKQTCW